MAGQTLEAKRTGATVPAKKSGGPGRVPRVAGVSKILKKDLVPFTRQLASMTAAGMPLIECFQSLEGSAKNPEFKKVLGYLKSTVEDGSPLSSGMQAFPKIFDTMYVNMILAGEQSGKFDKIMKRLTVIIQSAATLQKKIKGALTYPKIVVSIAILISGGLIVFVVPQFGEMFGAGGKKLPGLTQFLLDIANLIKAWWYIVGPVLVGLFLFIKWWKSTPSGHYILDRVALRTPVFGMLIQLGAIARFCRLLGEMLGSGIAILKALDIVSGSLGNVVLTKSIMDAREEVEQGVPLNQALTGKPFMPDMMIRMIASGEKSGRMQDMLDAVADTYDEEVNAMVGQLTALMEPLIMVVMGAILGTIVIALFLPIFQLPGIMK